MADIAIKPRSRLARVIVTLLGIAVFALLLVLGTWQVQRLHWKEGLLAEISARRALAPAALAEIEALEPDPATLDYRPVTVTGTFFNDHESHFLATLDGDAGFYLYTPLQLSDGRFVFINRGFVPEQKKDPATRPQSLIAGPVTITGLARPKLLARPSSMVPDNDIAKDIFFWKDLDAMAQRAGLKADQVIPFFIDADATPNPGGLPIGGVTIFDLPNSHLQYAVTWYGLAAALLVISGLVLVARAQAGCQSPFVLTG